MCVRASFYKRREENQLDESHNFSHPGRIVQYYHVLILIELYFNNFNYFSNFRPLTCFIVMTPETV